MVNLFHLNTKLYNNLSYVADYYTENIFVQSDLEKTLQYIKQQYRKNSINKNKIDLKGNNLLIYESDGGYYEFDLNVVSEIKSEYHSGKYLLFIRVNSNSTLLRRDEVNVIKHYDSQGLIDSKEVGLGMPFNTYQNATLTRDAIRKLKNIVNS